MLNIYLSTPEGAVHEVDQFLRGSWIQLTHPTQEEINQVVQLLDIPKHFITDPLDEEERSRVEKEGNNLLIIVDIPIELNMEDREPFVTLPLGMIITESYFITVCLKPTPLLEAFKNNQIKHFYTYMKTRFVLQLLSSIAAYYLQCLKQIHSQRDQIEEELHHSLGNKQLFTLLQLDKSLVYFTTSLKSNNIVTESLLNNKYLKMYSDDEELLNNVIIENKQAIEMAEIYSHILMGTTNAFASIISNNLNRVMKVLTSMTIVLTIPVLIASLYGMNIPLPLQKHPYMFPIILFISFILTSLITIILKQKKYF